MVGAIFLWGFCEAWLSSRSIARRHAACDGHHKMSDLAANCELVHSGTLSVESNVVARAMDARMGK